MARVLGVEAGQFFPSTGYAPTWPPDFREDDRPFYFGPNPQVLESIEAHLAIALGEFRKVLKNCSNSAATECLDGSGWQHPEPP